MNVTAALVLYAVCWFLTFFVVLPLRLTTQGDAGQVVPGTPAGAPAGFVVRRKALLTTVAATLIWALVCGIILSGWIGIADLDWFGRMGRGGAAG
jgi:predicted secreted protein